MEQKWNTHQVKNQFEDLSDYNLFGTDAVLKEYFEARSTDWAIKKLEALGAELGTADALHQAQLANQYTPVLKAFDSRGNRIDQVEFHPAWHYFMRKSKGSGMISIPFESKQKDRWAYFGAAFMVMSQIEAGSMCPTTMTQGAIPLLMREKELWKLLGPKLLNHAYDQRDVPIAEKESVWLGMGMTEKQGGSDVRSNQTTAEPLDKAGRGEKYLIRGHKWFYSAPMCDAHLVIAKTTDTGDLGCFFVPRWRLDGSKNAIHIQRLKEKVGNRSNSSSEVEFHDAEGILIGEEGRGIATIIEMANYTRLACVLGSTGMLRQATVQSIAYTRKREAFGRKLIEQPLMRSVLCDFALETEAAQHLSLKLCEAFEADDSDLKARAWRRIITPAAKYWVCKRAEALTAEAMEVFGGNGYVEEGIISRLFKEAPVNSIWEGSGNIMCLDVLRAIGKEPELVEILLQDLDALGKGNQQIREAMAKLKELFTQDAEQMQSRARLLTEKLMIIVQAAIMQDRAPDFMAEAFIRIRLVEGMHSQFGAYSSEISEEKILERTFSKKEALESKQDSNQPSPLRSV